MEYLMIGDMAKGRTNLIQTLVQLVILESKVEEIPDTPLEEFEKGIEELLNEQC
jgi:hypothetical protein